MSFNRALCGCITYQLNCYSLTLFLPKLRPHHGPHQGFKKIKILMTYCCIFLLGLGMAKHLGHLKVIVKHKLLSHRTALQNNYISWGQRLAISSRKYFFASKQCKQNIQPLEYMEFFPHHNCWWSEFGINYRLPFLSPLKGFLQLHTILGRNPRARWAAQAESQYPPSGCIL